MADGSAEMEVTDAPAAASESTSARSAHGHGRGLIHAYACAMRHSILSLCLTLSAVAQSMSESLC